MATRLYQRITVYGRVQGVGFRPALCRIGVELGLKGYVRNAGGFVEIVAAGKEGSLMELQQRIQTLPMPVAVERLRVETLTATFFDQLYGQASQEQKAGEFFAIASLEASDKSFSPADLAICPLCEAELKARGNRRYGYSYISCAQCGPRYTIMRRLPYDRVNTTMDVFKLCPKCSKEFNEPGNRRQHGETISCLSCGPQLVAYIKGETAILEGETALIKAKQLLQAEKIILVKAIGGFNLVCLATSTKAVAELRRLKKRPTKPFAVMCGSLDGLKSLCKVSLKEEELLQSAIRPIVLLKPLPQAKQLLAEGVADQCAALGAMLPSMGFYAQLCELGAPLIVTSCNQSGAPIIYKDAEALEYYRATAETAGLFTYEREILRPADDAVVRSVRLVGANGVITERTQVLRRTRGYLPEPIEIDASNEKAAPVVLAMGAEMEPSFCLLKKTKAYAAQLPSRIEEESSEAEYLSREADWEKLLALTPEVIVSDLHPGYCSTSLGRQLAEARGFSFKQVQHHQAHALSVMAEHGLEGPCLAVCFDGTGYGLDGTIWGGEFLVCEKDKFRRVAHLAAVPMLGGDASMKQAWKSAMCYGAALEQEEAFQSLLSQDARYAIVKAALANGINIIHNSSMGRLFDVASYLLGLASENSHQGRCAMALEAMANLALDLGLPPLEMHLSKALEGSVSAAEGVWTADHLWKPLAEAREQGGQAIAQAALGFHRAVIELVVRVAEQQGMKQVLLGGGCFANRILLEGCYEALTASGFEVYFNQQAAPGDGGLALGQAYYASLAGS